MFNWFSNYRDPWEYTTKLQPWELTCISLLSFRLCVDAQLMSPHWETGWCRYHVATSSNLVLSGDSGVRVCPFPRAPLSAATWWWSSRCSSPTGSHLSLARSSSTVWPSANCVLWPDLHSFTMHSDEYLVGFTASISQKEREGKRVLNHRLEREC